MRNFPNFKDNDLSYFGWRQEPYFSSELISGGLSNTKNLKKYFGLSRPLQLLQVGYDFFNVEKTLQKFTKDLVNKIHQSDKRYIDKVVSGCLNLGDKLLSTAERINLQAKSQTLSNHELASLLEEFFKETYTYCVYYIVAWFEKPERELAEKLAKKYAQTEQEFQEIFSTITTPSRETAAEYEQDDFLKLCSLHAKKAVNISQLAAKHAEKYGWLSVRYFIGDPWTTSDIINRLRASDTKKAGAMLKSRITHRKEIHKKLGAFLKKVSKKDQELITQIRDIIFLRTQRSDFFHHASYFMQPMLKNIATRLDVGFADLLNFKPQEIIQALRGKYTIHDHVAHRRMCLVAHFNSQSQILEGKDALAYVQKRPILKRLTTQTQSLTGIPAFNGAVKGAVKVVLNNTDLKKVAKGDILVTTMTTPNFIAAMEKARAFVTDEGGILCHAAIISREMKKPCIIGTKIATQIFKDGDMVEVDANKGIVKKL